MAEILSLPTNKIPLTTEEKEMAEWLFPKKVNEVNEAHETPKPVEKRKPPDIKISPPPSSSSYTPSVTILSKIILVISLFYVFNLPKVDTKIRNLFRFENAYLSTLCKTIFFYLIIFTISVLM